MDKLLAFRLLQVAVAAPWLWYISGNKGTPAYFNYGLKGLAATLVIINGPPIYRAIVQHGEIIRTLYAQHLRAQQDAEARIIEGEAIEQEP